MREKKQSLIDFFVCAVCCFVWVYNLSLCKGKLAESHGGKKLKGHGKWQLLVTAGPTSTTPPCGIAKEGSSS
jgi:hypothetical protein